MHALETLYYYYYYYYINGSVYAMHSVLEVWLPRFDCINLWVHKILGGSVQLELFVFGYSFIIMKTKWPRGAIVSLHLHYT